MQGKKWRTPENEGLVIELYAEHKSVIKVAEIVGCGRSTVTNILVDNNVPRVGKHNKHPRPKQQKVPKVRKSNCRSKYCPALIVMLHEAFGWNAKQIAEATGYAENGTRNILSKRGLTGQQYRVSHSDLNLDQIEREYLAGTSSYELGEKYGMNPTTISKWMRKRGIHLGKGAHQEGRKGKTKASGEFVYTERMREINQRSHDDGERRFIKKLAETQNGRFEYVGGFRDGGKLVATIRCAACGHEFVHGITDMDKKTWQCPQCNEVKRREQEQEREAQRYERMFSELREYAVAKTCAHCGETFQSSNPTAKYCSKKCARKAHDSHRIRINRSRGHHHYYHVKYGERYLEHYDPSITLKKLYERDGGVCQICGKPCDWDDKKWGDFGPTYPSIDHIVPRAQGGDHFWSNVQLAHCICNSHKRDMPNEIAREVVTQNVEITS